MSETKTMPDMPETSGFKMKSYKIEGKEGEEGKEELDNKESEKPEYKKMSADDVAAHRLQRFEKFCGKMFGGLKKTGEVVVGGLKKTGEVAVKGILGWDRRRDNAVDAGKAFTKEFGKQWNEQMTGAKEIIKNEFIKWNNERIKNNIARKERKARELKNKVARLEVWGDVKKGAEDYKRLGQQTERENTKLNRTEKSRDWLIKLKDGIVGILDKMIMGKEVKMNDLEESVKALTANKDKVGDYIEEKTHLLSSLNVVKESYI